jgi:hypothetical protein
MAATISTVRYLLTPIPVALHTNLLTLRNPRMTGALFSRTSRRMRVEAMVTRRQSIMRPLRQSHGDRDSIRVDMARSQRTQCLRRINRDTRVMVLELELVLERVGINSSQSSSKEDMGVMEGMMSNLLREAGGSGVKVVTPDGKACAITVSQCCEHMPRAGRMIYGID